MAVVLVGKVTQASLVEGGPTDGLLELHASFIVRKSFFRREWMSAWVRGVVQDTNRLHQDRVRRLKGRIVLLYVGKAPSSGIEVDVVDTSRREAVVITGNGKLHRRKLLVPISDLYMQAEGEEALKVLEDRRGLDLGQFRGTVSWQIVI